MSLADWVKLLAVLAANGRRDMIARKVDEFSTAELRQALTVAVTLLAEARSA